MAERIFVTHPFEPVYDKDSRILILGSFPSVRSREQKFFYGHPRNRFWRLLAETYEQPLPQTIEQKTAFLLDHRIALWDVIASCEICGSSDSSIRNAHPTDLTPILQTADIHTMIANGQTAGKLFAKYQEKIWDRKAVVLPSTSPANAAVSMQQLLDRWRPYLLLTEEI